MVEDHSQLFHAHIMTVSRKPYKINDNTRRFFLINFNRLCTHIIHLTVAALIDYNQMLLQRKQLMILVS